MQGIAKLLGTVFFVITVLLTTKLETLHLVLTAVVQRKMENNDSIQMGHRLSKLVTQFLSQTAKVVRLLEIKCFAIDEHNESGGGVACLRKRLKIDHCPT